MKKMWMIVIAMMLLLPLAPLVSTTWADDEDYPKEDDEQTENKFEDAEGATGYDPSVDDEEGEEEEEEEEEDDDYED